DAEPVLPGPRGPWRQENIFFSASRRAGAPLGRGSEKHDVPILGIGGGNGVQRVAFGETNGHELSNGGPARGKSSDDGEWLATIITPKRDGAECLYRWRTGGADGRMADDRSSSHLSLSPLRRLSRASGRQGARARRRPRGCLHGQRALGVLGDLALQVADDFLEDLDHVLALCLRARAPRALVRAQVRELELHPGQ